MERNLRGRSPGRPKSARRASVRRAKPKHKKVTKMNAKLNSKSMFDLRLCPEGAGSDHKSGKSGGLVSVPEPAAVPVPTVKNVEPTATPAVGEADLPEQDELQISSEAEALLSVFLAAAVPVPANSSIELRQALTDATVSLLKSIKAKDAIDHMGSSLLIAMNLAGLDCFARAAACGDNSAARDLNLRSGIKIGSVVSDLMKGLDARHGQGRYAVNVRSVNVEPGGQAIVGNVENSDKPAPASSDVTRGTRSRSTR